MAILHTVSTGECLSSIAQDYGFFWETLWNWPDNADLKQTREDPNILLEDDVLTIPDRRLKEENAATEQRHRFRVKGPPVKLRLRLLEPKERGTEAAQSAEELADSGYQDPDYKPDTPGQQPRVAVPYLLVIGSVTFRGKTDSDGRIEVRLSPSAREARLILNPGTDNEEILLLGLGELDPLKTVSGVRRRLINLGFACGDGPESGPDLEAALSAFQDQNQLPTNGKLDDTTRNKLRDRHGS